MKRWGIHVEVWSGVGVGSPYEVSVPVHRGTLTEAIAAVKPDILHVHWVNIANERGAEMIASGLPVTVRAHGFEVTADAIRQLLNLPTLKRAFFFPHQMSAFANEPRLKTHPCRVRYFVVHARTEEGPPSRHSHFSRFAEQGTVAVFRRGQTPAGSSFLHPCRGDLQGRGILHSQAHRRTATKRSAPVELMNDVSREKLAPLVRQAAFYLHTALPPDRGGTPLGMPISIAEAMGTGTRMFWCATCAKFTSRTSALAGSGLSRWRNTRRK